MCRPLRGHARFHRYSIYLEGNAIPAGAVVPAKGVDQISDIACSYIHHRLRDMAGKGLPV
ncbi:hypothetical protein E8E68_26125 [Pseudomonas sp. BN607]|nr:hypothetical protein [Pseudomonas sp. BN607]